MKYKGFMYKDVNYSLLIILEKWEKSLKAVMIK